MLCIILLSNQKFNAENQVTLPVHGRSQKFLKEANFF